MATDTIRVGLIGANVQGSWGTRAHLPALQALPGFTVTAVCTSRQETADETARRFGIPYALADPRQLAQHPEVDLVAVCVRVPAHHAFVMAALNAGKHVFCEWPLGVNSEQAAAMLNLAERTGVCHMVGLQARAAPVVNYVKDLVAQGYVGRLLACTMTASSTSWGGTFSRAQAYLADRANGATFLSIPGGHAIDALCYCVGEFRELSATLATERTQVTVVETGQRVEMTSPDQVLVSGILASGAVASIHIKGGIANPSGFSLELNGTEGDLVISAEGGVQLSALTVRGAQGQGGMLRDLPLPERYRWVPAAVPSGPPLNVAQLYAKLAEGIRERRPVSPDFSVGVARHRWLDLIQLAADSGRRQTATPS